MSTSSVASASVKQKWETDFFAEYQRDSLFAPYMGSDANSVIYVNDDLESEGGNTINIPLFVRLTGNGVTGDNQMRENEEALSNYNHAVAVDQIRNAVLWGGMERQKTDIDLLAASRSALKLWIMDDQRDAILTALGSPNTDGTTAYASCTEAQKDAWLAQNYVSATNTRILFGAAVSNSSTEDHSTSLSNVDSSTDTLDFDMIQFMKRLLKKADPHVRPIKVRQGREFYVTFSESYGFRDLKVDTETLHTNAGVRGDDNPMFQDPDLMLDGVAVREVPEIAAISGVGASSIDVGPHYMCGAQAVIMGWAQRSKIVVDRTIDYSNQTGVCIGEIRGVEKSTFNNFQHGVGTIYAAAVADS